jgi:DNA-binding CsgD family transcriptional regulator
MVSTVVTVEQALDSLARRDPVDVPALVARARERIGATASGVDDALAADSAAHVAHAEASLTRLSGPDPEAWSRAARRWEALADPWAVATARLHEADAAASTGDAARAAASLQEAHRLASELGAAPLIAQIGAVSRRTRLSVEAAPPKVVDAASIDRLGLTPREAEVLSLVAIGHSNRQIGEALYVSEKTASVHVSNILRKLGVSSRVDAAAVAQRLGVA